uniref:Interleukin 22 receptor subunit alpha 2 n=1 Tax=Erpetoichthys calabaricus TaxID=27687 RepID=A0A8C4SRD8_ERPCA
MPGLCLISPFWLLPTDCPEMIDGMRPQDVDFRSENYNNILHWIPGCQWEEDTTYFVQYKIYGDKRWTNKVECWGIKNTFCDLSQETTQSSEWYYARVRAAISRRKSGWAVSPRFIPAFTKQGHLMRRQAPALVGQVFKVGQILTPTLYVYKASLVTNRLNYECLNIWDLEDKTGKLKLGELATACFLAPGFLIVCLFSIHLLQSHVGRGHPVMSGDLIHHHLLV